MHCEAAPELEILGDPDSLIRLLANLIDNAIKYSEGGMINISASRAGDGQVRVEVQDTGIGIPAEHMPHIFERFYRVDSSRASEGVGLGLAIAQAIAEAHGGSIQVSSQVGAGTSFVILLPDSAS